MASPWGAGTPFKSCAPVPWVIGDKAFGQTAPVLMGVLNITPDSFFDGGRYDSAPAALEQAAEMVEQGADIIDVGAESSRPGARPVSAAMEKERLAKILPALVLKLSTPVSVDTTKSDVAEWALGEGASIINDISGFTLDPEMKSLASRKGASVVINHMRGRPRDMQTRPEYGDVVHEVADFLGRQALLLQKAGIPREKIAVDPGIGFGKDLKHNYQLLKYLEVFSETGCPILVGPSRKSFIGKTPGLEDSDRLHPTTAVCLWSALKGVTVLRVHDVKAVKEQLIQIEAILKS